MSFLELGHLLANGLEAGAEHGGVSRYLNGLRELGQLFANGFEAGAGHGGFLGTWMASKSLATC